MILVGASNGFLYSNVLFLIINSSKLEKKQKELAIMICGILSNSAILIATLAALALSNTVFRDA